MAAAMSVSAVVPPAAAVARARTLLCVPATARAPREMAAEVAAAAALGADLAELRLDRLAGFAPRRDLPALLAKPRTLPALVTYRWVRPPPLGTRLISLGKAQSSSVDLPMGSESWLVLYWGLPK
jgi:hypothetical protein